MQIGFQLVRLSSVETVPISARTAEESAQHIASVPPTLLTPAGHVLAVGVAVDWRNLALSRLPPRLMQRRHKPRKKTWMPRAQVTRYNQVIGQTLEPPSVT